MLNVNSYLNTPMAYYVAGLATADYLTGEYPEAIRRWDSSAPTNPLKIAEHTHVVAVLGTEFTPILVSDVLSRDEVKRAKATALNYAFVALSGIAGMQGVDRFRNETAQPLINLVASDLNRAASIIGSVCAPEMGTYLALQVLEATMKFFQGPAIKEVVEELAHDVLRYGEVSDGDYGLINILHDLQGIRIVHPEKIIEWPVPSQKGFAFKASFVPQDGNGPA